MSTIVSVPDSEIVRAPGYGEEGRDVLKQQCIDLRIEVFVHEQGFSLDGEIDEHDETATHILLRLIPSLTPIGTIRCYRVDGSDCYKLSRLVVLKEYRKYRLGGALVLALHDWVLQDAKQAGLISPIRVITHSQLPVKGFYARYGYKPEGDEFDEDGAPHQKMVASLSF